MAKADPRGIGSAIANIMKWARQPEWAALHEKVLDEHIGAALKELELDSADELAEELGRLAFDVGVAGPVFEDFLNRANADGETIVDEYLRRRGFKENVPGRRYLEALGSSVMSLYEVVEAVPDSHLVLRDLVRGGEPVRVEERSGSRQAVKWDLVGARVLIHNRRPVLSGAIVPLEPERAWKLLEALRAGAQTSQRMLEQAIIETVTGTSVEPADPDSDSAAFERALRTVVREQAGSDDPEAIKRAVDGKFGGLTADSLLHHCAPFFTRTWLAQTLDRLLGPPPELRNYDGDPIRQTETRWPLTGGAAPPAKRLDDAESRSIRRFDPDAQRWTWIGDKSLSRGPGVPVTNHESSGEELDLVNLGYIEIDEGELVLQTNSEARAARGRALLEDLLRGLVGQAAVSHQDVADEAAVQLSGGGRLVAGLGVGDAEPAADIPAEEMARLLGEFKDRHYRHWLDAATPALGGKTPRQAAAEDERDRLVRLLKDIENGELRSARSGRAPAYDASWIWRELGLQADAA